MRQTALYDWHLEQGAKMVPFAGYQMPVQYPDGVLKEHLHTREHAGLFDVSHMGIVHLKGEAIAQALEVIMPADLLALEKNEQCYSLLCNEQGGVIDDLMVANMGDYWQIVVNAACKENDIAYIRKHLPDGIELEEKSDWALLAIQGPAACDIIGQSIDNIEAMSFMAIVETQIAGVDCVVSRSGYTGEDGFEIACANEQVRVLLDHLLTFDTLKPIGLGARDSLRLEAGLCLYGHDLDEQTTPIEGGLTWVIKPARRQAPRDNFIGSEAILKHIQDGVDRKRVGLAINSRAPVREDVEVFNDKQELVGKVCSGGFSPSLKKPIAMAYVDAEYAKIDTPLIAMVRNKPIDVTVCKMPFVAHNFYRG